MRHGRNLLAWPGRFPGTDAIPNRANSMVGAIVPGRELLPDRAPSFGAPGPQPFDAFAIIANPGTGTTTTLIGPTATSVIPTVPVGYRALIDGISPYLEGAAGPIGGPRIPGAGVTYTWRLLLNGRPAPYYAAITNILGAWDAVSIRSLLEVPPNVLVTATVTIVDPGLLYSFVGLRVRGRLVPWTRDFA